MNELGAMGESRRVVLREVTALAVVGALAILGGCTSTSEPMVSPSVSVSAVAASSPSPTLSHEEQMLALIPEEAKGDDLFAAEAMAKFFITLHPGLYQGDDPALWEFLCMPESVYCSSALESSAERLARGERQFGGEITIPDQLSDLILDEYELEPTALVRFYVTQAPLYVADEMGRVFGERGESEHHVAFALQHTNGLWRIAAVEVW